MTRPPLISTDISNLPPRSVSHRPAELYEPWDPVADGRTLAEGWRSSRAGRSPSSSPTSRARPGCSSSCATATATCSRAPPDPARGVRARTAAGDRHAGRLVLRRLRTRETPRSPRSAAQRALAEHGWPDGAEVRVRMGMHTGEPVVGDERYVGLGVHRAARIVAAGHGGQVLLSQATRELSRTTADRDRRARPRRAPAQGPRPPRAHLPARHRGPAGRVSAAAHRRRPDRVLPRGSRARPVRRRRGAAASRAARCGCRGGRVSAGFALFGHGGGRAPRSRSRHVGRRPGGSIRSRARSRGEVPVSGPPHPVAVGRAPSGSRTPTATASRGSIRRQERRGRRSPSAAARAGSRSATAPSGSPTASTAPSRGSTRRRTPSSSRSTSATGRSGSPTRAARSGSRTPATARSRGSTPTPASRRSRCRSPRPSSPSATGRLWASQRRREPRRADRPGDRQRRAADPGRQRADGHRLRQRRSRGSRTASTGRSRGSIRRRTRRPRLIPTGNGPTSASPSAPAGVWVSNQFGGTVARIDPRTNRSSADQRRQPAAGRGGRGRRRAGRAFASPGQATAAAR